MYADLEFYKETYKGTLEDAKIEKALQQASRHIDTLTYNRIVAIGIENLTEFQQGIIKECECLMADWEMENEDYIGSSASATVVNGVAVSRDIYSHLQKCGLCCRVLRG